MREMQYMLSKRELQYLMNPYRNDLMGVGYLLSNDRQDELRIQESLLSKAYAISDFDFSFSVNQDLTRILKECNNWHYMIQLTSSSLDQQEAFHRYFVNQEMIVHEHKLQDTISIEATQIESMIMQINNHFSIDANHDEGNISYYTVNAKTIEILSRLRKDRLLNEIRKDGCPDNLAEIIAEALSGNGEYACVTLLERTQEDIQIKRKLTVWQLDDTCLIIHPVAFNGTQCIHFAFCNSDILREELDKIRRAVI